MRFLLDTHTLLWWVEGTDVLSASVQNRLDDRVNDLLISVATPWELAIKTNTGKLDARRLLRDLEQGLLGDQLAVLQAETKHVIRAGYLPPHHKDPFDRLLVAQALDLHLPIISSNKTLDLYGVQRIWD